MIEVKFKAWDKNTQKMSRVFFVWEAYRILNGLLLKYKNINNELPTLLQYTGLKDKNGVEIYEGDIYKYDVGDYSPEIGIFKSIKDFYYNELIRFRVEEGEVIGNIYQNPELLELIKK